MDAKQEHGPEQSAGQPNHDARLEELRVSTLSAIHSYQRNLQTQLDEYKTQRAWKIMLFFRKAYTQLVRNGWKGRKDFLVRGIARWFGGQSDLDYFDLTFPDLWNY